MWLGISSLLSDNSGWKLIWLASLCASAALAPRALKRLVRTNSPPSVFSKLMRKPRISNWSSIKTKSLLPMVILPLPSSLWIISRLRVSLGSAGSLDSWLTSPSRIKSWAKEAPTKPKLARLTTQKAASPARQGALICVPYNNRVIDNTTPSSTSPMIIRILKAASIERNERSGVKNSNNGQAKTIPPTTPIQAAAKAKMNKAPTKIRMGFHTLLMISSIIRMPLPKAAMPLRRISPNSSAPSNGFFLLPSSFPNSCTL